MRRILIPGLLAALLVLGLAVKAERAATQPLAPQAQAEAATERRLVEAGWLPLSATRLLADGSLSAREYLSGACRMNVTLLPPGGEHAAILQEAWGERARFFHAGAWHPAPPPQEGRLRNLARHWLAALGGSAAPSLFSLAIAAEGDCAGRLPRHP